MRKFSALVLSLILIIPSSFIFAERIESGGAEIILKVAVQDEMKTKNILGVNDVWTSHVLWRCFESVLQSDPETLNPVPHILVGFEQGHNTLIDAEDRILPPESAGFLPMPELDYIHPELLPPKTEADPGKHEIVAYYDFRGVKFHDGEQATINDVIFSYYFLALHPNWYSGIAPLMDAGGLGGNFSTDRWLGIWDVSDEYSNDDNPLTSALSFHLSTNYVQLWIDTMSVPIFPQHIWEGKGKVRLSDGIYRTNIHGDFGYAIDANGIGVPVDHPTLKEFDLMVAMDWEPKDDEVVGTGMFQFKEWITGSHAKVVTNDGYLEMETGGLSIHKPYIDGIEFIKYSTTQQATMALRKGEVDIMLWFIPPYFIYDLLIDPNIALIGIPEPGVTYLGFNMRTAVLGYPNGDPTQGDAGKPLREAIAHLTDKKTIVDYYLQGYGIIADGPVSPWSPWFNHSLPTRPFAPDLAISILDANNLVDNDKDGWRDTDTTTPGDQDDAIEILAPVPEYCPIRAQACIQMENEMKRAGLNISCNLKSFGSIVSRLDDEDFDMVILGWSTGYIEYSSFMDPTDYFYGFFYCGNSGKPQNHWGYCNPLFDQVIDKARSEMDITKQQELIEWAQGIVVEDLPINFLFYRKNIEAYRKDMFIGWIEFGGSIFNYWSLMNIKPPTDKFLRATITVASAVSSNKTETITVTVRDQDRNVVKDASVNVTVEFGNLRVGGTDYGRFYDGLTNLNGQVIVNFVAPYVANENGTKISITIKATKLRYDDSGIKSTFITVFPPGVKFLSVTIILKYGDLIDEMERTEIDVIVKDENLQPIDGAIVNITSFPKGLHIEPSNGTTSNGGKIEGIILTAPNVDCATRYIIKVAISKPGYKSVNGTIELTVFGPCNHYPPPTPHFPLLTLLLLAIIFVVVAAILIKLQKPKEKPKR